MITLNWNRINAFEKLLVFQYVLWRPLLIHSVFWRQFFLTAAKPDYIKDKRTVFDSDASRQCKETSQKCLEWHGHKSRSFTPDSSSAPITKTSRRSRINSLIGESRSSQQEILFPMEVRTDDLYNHRSNMCQNKQCKNLSIWLRNIQYRKGVRMSAF